MNFREQDTIAMIELMEYEQNKVIDYKTRKERGDGRDEQNSNVSNEQHMGTPISENVGTPIPVPYRSVSGFNSSQH